MASSKLKSKLAKATRKRRKRLSAGADGPSSSDLNKDDTVRLDDSGQPSSGAGEDVVGILVRGILACADERKDVGDGVALSVLRGFALERPPKSDPAQQIHQSISQQIEQNGLSDRRVPRAAEELLELVKPYSDPTDQQCILRFLSLLVE